MKSEGKKKANIRAQLLYVLRIYGTAGQMIKVINRDLLYSVKCRGKGSFPETFIVLSGRLYTALLFLVFLAQKGRKRILLEEGCEITRGR